MVRINKDSQFLGLFTISLLVAFSPLKQIAQIWPVIFYIILTVIIVPQKKLHIVRFVILGIVLMMASLIYELVYDDQFWFSNFLFSLFTFSPFFIFVFDLETIMSLELIRRIRIVIIVILFVEAIIGIAEFMYSYFYAQGSFKGTVGDLVWGTLATPFTINSLGSSPIFILLFSSSLIFILSLSRRVTFSTLVLYGVCFTCWLLALLIHSIVYFCIAIILSAFSIRYYRKSLSANLGRKAFLISSTLIGIVILLVAGFLFDTNSYRRVGQVIRAASEISPDARFIKQRVTYFTLFSLSEGEILQPIIGLGPGHYSSRAALMLSGQYLTRASIPFFPHNVSDATVTYILPFIGRQNSSNHFPSSSWITLYGELGGTGLTIFISLIIIGFRRLNHTHSKLFQQMNFWIMVLLIYLLLMGLQNVYWEYTQSLFIPLLLIKISFDFLKAEQKHHFQGGIDNTICT